MSPDYKEVFQLFREHADEQQAIEMSAYMRDMFPFLGLPKPTREKLQREFITAAKKATSVDWSFVKTCWAMEREFQYLALDYLRALTPLLGADDIPRLRELAITKSWWDTVDCLDAIVGEIALRSPQLNAVLLLWSADKNFWLRRIAIDHQLQRKERTDTALLEQIIVNNFGQKEFFINKAIGWALREYSKTDSAWVSDFINRYRKELAPLSIREASKYL